MGMRTITLKFVVDKDDIEASDRLIDDALENDLNTLTLIEWTDRGATKAETRRHARQEAEKGLRAPTECAGA